MNATFEWQPYLKFLTTVLIIRIDRYLNVILKLFNYKYRLTTQVLKCINLNYNNKFYNCIGKKKF